MPLTCWSKRFRNIATLRGQMRKRKRKANLIPSYLIFILYSTSHIQTPSIILGWSLVVSIGTIIDLYTNQATYRNYGREIYTLYRAYKAAEQQHYIVSKNSSVSRKTGETDRWTDRQTYVRSAIKGCSYSPGFYRARSSCTPARPRSGT